MIIAKVIFKRVLYYMSSFDTNEQILSKGRNKLEAAHESHLLRVNYVQYSKPVFFFYDHSST